MAAGIGACVSRAAHSPGNYLQQLIGDHLQALCVILSGSLKFLSMFISTTSTAIFSSHSTKPHVNRGPKAHPSQTDPSKTDPSKAHLSKAHVNRGPKAH